LSARRARGTFNQAKELEYEAAIRGDRFDAFEWRDLGANLGRLNVVLEVGPQRAGGRCGQCALHISDETRKWRGSDPRSDAAIPLHLATEVRVNRLGVTPMASMVVIRFPAAAETGVMQDRVGWPLM
jgi:hypothetical protein